MYFTIVFLIIVLQYTIISSQPTVCANAFSCVNETIIGGQINAYGYKSNIGSQSVLYGTLIHCDGGYACNNVGNITGSNIRCESENGCDNTNMYATYGL